MALQCLPEAFDSACWWGSFETYQHASCRESWPLQPGQWTKSNNVSPALIKKITGCLIAGCTRKSVPYWIAIGLLAPSLHYCISNNCDTSPLCLANTFIPFIWKTLHPVWWQLHPAIPSRHLTGMAGFVQDLTKALVWRLGTWCCSLAVPTACQQHWKGGHPFTQPFLGSKKTPRVKSRTWIEENNGWYLKDMKDNINNCKVWKLC